LNIIQLVKRL